MRQGLSDLLAEYDVLAAFWMTIKLTVDPPSGPSCWAPSLRSCGYLRLPCSGPPGRRTSRWCATHPLTLIVFFCAFGFYITLQYRIGAQGSAIDIQNFRWGVLGLAVYHAAFAPDARPEPAPRSRVRARLPRPRLPRRISASPSRRCRLRSWPRCRPCRPASRRELAAGASQEPAGGLGGLRLCCPSLRRLGRNGAFCLGGIGHGRRLPPCCAAYARRRRHRRGCRPSRRAAPG